MENSDYITPVLALRELLASWMSLTLDSPWLTLILLAIAVAVSIAGFYVTSAILKLVAILVEKTETDWDDDLINAPLLRAISLLAPALIALWLLPLCFYRDNTLADIIHLLASFYVIGVTVYAANKFLDNLLSAFAKRVKFRAYAVKGIFQMIKLIFIGIGIIIALSLLVGKSPVAILTALGASAAILMLVFKDTIMGLVASVQLTANKMLRKGDWIVVPKHGANGEVTDISLTTVKIRNWDNSITTVPPYSLVSDSFQNFQAMRQSGARRVCRAVYVDMDSIRYLNEEELTRIQKSLGFPAENSEAPAEGYYIDEAAKEYASSVNLSIFRDYMEDWLSHHPQVRTDLIYMVRQLEPTPHGLPVELYFFLGVTDWKKFEHLQADIFNHLYAVAPLFGLDLFQAPSGKDIAQLGRLASDTKIR